MDDDQTWAAQLGPAYSAGQVARLLGVTELSSTERRGLLCLEQRDGQQVYPAFQLDDGQVLPGIDTVVQTFAPVVASAWTTASWLTSHQAELGGRRPVDALRRGDVSDVIRAAERATKHLSA
jgi:hypothetical protein